MLKISLQDCIRVFKRIFRSRYHQQSFFTPSKKHSKFRRFLKRNGMGSQTRSNKKLQSFIFETLVCSGQFFFFIKNGPSPESFSFNFDFSNISEKMSIQSVVLGFEPTTFKTQVSHYNHQTRAPAFGSSYPYLLLFYSVRSN